MRSIELVAGRGCCEGMAASRFQRLRAVETARGCGLPDAILKMNVGRFVVKG